MPLTWLSDRSVSSVRGALRQHAPELSDANIEVQPWLEQGDPKWWHGRAVVDGRFFVKFAWSRPAAERVWHEARILKLLGAHSTALRVPRVVAASDDPALLATEWIAGEPLTIELVGMMDSRRLADTARELARFLADLHHSDVLADLRRAIGPLATPLPQATTKALREGLTPWIRSDQVRSVNRWSDWADLILAVPVDFAFVHGDFHGHNQLWDHTTQTLHVVLDYGESGAGDPAFDFRYLPSQGPDTTLFRTAAMHYGKYTSLPLDVFRVMAWHIRTVLGDALWRSRAGVPLPDGRTPTDWVDDLRRRLSELDVAVA